MQQQSNVTNGQKQNSILVLLLNWIIILGVYLLIRIVFIVLGFHLYTPLLGGLLAIIPYLLGTIYLWKSCNQYKIWFYVLAILLPSIVEKITLYLFGSFLYNLSPTNIVEVMETVISLPSESYLPKLSNSYAHYSILFSSMPPKTCLLFIKNLHQNSFLL